VHIVVFFFLFGYIEYNKATGVNCKRQKEVFGSPLRAHGRQHTRDCFFLHLHNFQNSNNRHQFTKLFLLL